MRHTHFPRHWATAPLEDVTEFITSGSRGWGEYYSELGPIFLRVGNLNHDTIQIDLSNAARVQPPSGSEGLRTRVKEGDILISITAEVGMIGLARPGLGEAYVNQHVALVRPLPSVYSEGLAYSLLDPQGLQSVARREQYGATKPGLSLIQVRGFEVPIPPVPEQRRLVAAIDSYFTRLDDAVTTLERVERNLKRYRASVLKAAVEGRLVPTEAALAKQEGRDYEPASVLLERVLNERRRRWSESGRQVKYQGFALPDMRNLPDLPEGWCWTTAETVCEQVVDCHNKTAPYVEEGIPLLRTTNIRKGVVKFDDLRYVTEETYAYWSRRCPPLPGDVLFTREAPMGEAAIVPGGMKVCMGQRMMLLRADPQLLHPQYLLLAVQAPHILHYATQRAVGIGVQHLRVRDVENLPIPFAPILEQRRIIEESERQLTVIEALGQVQLANEKRCQRLRQSILKWAFEGKLADQDPTEEPASVLLERIKAERDTPKPVKKKSRA